MESNRADAPDTGELAAEGGYPCPYCGLDTPHHHSPEDVIALRAVKVERARFEKYVAIWINRQDVMHAMRYGAASFAYLLLERWPGGYREYKSPMVELLWQLWQVATIELRKRVIQAELQGFIDNNKASLPSDSGELERLLKAMLEARRMIVAKEWRRFSEAEELARQEDAAFASVLDLFERLQKENARLIREARVNAEAVRLGLLELASLRSENERLQGQCLEDLRLALEAQKERDSLRSTAEGLEQWKVLAQKDLRGLRSENERLRGTKDL